jgi:hypothetical protein
MDKASTKKALKFEEEEEVKRVMPGSLYATSIRRSAS